MSGWQIVIAVIAWCIALFLVWRFYRRTARHPWQWCRARMGWGMSVDELARRLEISPRELRTIPLDYRQKLIPKRTGGMRQLHVPNERLMDLQRRILHRLLRRLRAHPAATGFERGQSIVHNARRHCGQLVLIRLDVHDFFPTTRADRIDAYFRRIGWNAEAAALLTQLTTHERGLPQGAPTSPRLSNLVNFGIDQRLANRVVRFRGVYTRYADDIAISLAFDKGRRVRGLIQYAGKLLKAHGYELHSRKQRILRPHQRQVVTGLVVNEKVQLPRELRRRLRAARHRLATGGECTFTPEQLAGYAALEHMVRQQRGEENHHRGTETQRVRREDIK